MSPASGSVAVMVPPTATPPPEFSCTLRLVLDSANMGGSFTFVRLIVTEISVSPPTAIAFTVIE